LVFIQTRAALEKCSSLQDESASPAKKAGVYSPIAANLHSVVIERRIAKINLSNKVGFIESFPVRPKLTSGGSTTGHLLSFALQKLRGSLRLIPAVDAVAA
jgi:hypothetical protein